MSSGIRYLKLQQSQCSVHYLKTFVPFTFQISCQPREAKSKRRLEAGEIAQQLKALAAPPENLHLILSVQST